MGYAAFGLLLLQWITGSYAHGAVGEEDVLETPFSAQAPGIVAMALIAYLFMDAVYIEAWPLESYYADTTAFMVAGGMFVAGTAIAPAPAVQRLWKLSEGEWGK